MGNRKHEQVVSRRSVYVSVAVKRDAEGVKEGGYHELVRGTPILRRKHGELRFHRLLPTRRRSKRRTRSRVFPYEALSAMDGHCSGHAISFFGYRNKFTMSICMYV